uniref:Uncharacterized protein n=1 Tax=Anguilla anguilla TaxID=7936 RepID=A0A0E9P7W7_ANGAN
MQLRQQDSPHIQVCHNVIFWGCEKHLEISEILDN